MSSISLPRLDQPLYGATFAQAITRFFRNYANFSGRASRSEYWWVALAMGILNLAFYGFTVATILANVSITAANVGDPSVDVVAVGGFGIVNLLFSIVALGLVVPGIALMWRRLHDTNKAGTYAFFAFIPLVGGILLLVFLLQPADPAGARFDRESSTARPPVERRSATTGPDFRQT